MDELNILKNRRNEILSFSLSNNYRNRSFTNDFNNHINSIFDCEYELGKNPDLISHDNFKFTNRRYSEAQENILAELDDIDEATEAYLSILEDDLYLKIEKELGRFYDNSDEIGLIIDNTVQCSILSLRFQYFKRSNEFINPWEDSYRILTEKNYLFKPIFDADEFNEIKKLKRTSKKSDIIKDTEIYVAVKGKNSHLNYCSFKDLIHLRKVLFDIIEEKVGDSNTPVKYEIILKLFDQMNSGLSDAEIKSKLLFPLKAISKIGSCKEGYFVLRNCEDIERSYKSHFNRWKGYYRTLEAHRLAALRLDNNCYDFSKHKSSN